MFYITSEIQRTADLLGLHPDILLWLGLDQIYRIFENEQVATS